jgi:hypothetical protein
MTYQQLLAHLLLLNEEQLQQEVTVYNCHAHVDEFYPLFDIDFATENDVLDKGHMFLMFDSRIKQ